MAATKHLSNFFSVQPTLALFVGTGSLCVVE
jgi:hypothetical protein